MIIMNKFTKDLVDSYANKLLIGLTDEENEMVLREFDLIDENLNLVNQIEGIENIEPMTHTLDDFVYVLREDKNLSSPNIDELLSNADVKNSREIIVPKVVG